MIRCNPMPGDKKRYQGGAHRGGTNNAPYPVSRLAPMVELVDMAKEIAAADHMVSNVATGKLKLIADQIRTLQAEAKQILAQAHEDQRLHRARCAFQRRPGETYHLYRKLDGSEYFSMLAPDEWGGTPPHQFIGSYRLENDLSWTSITQLGEVEEDEILEQLLNLE